MHAHGTGARDVVRLDLNAVVAHNVKAIRVARGLTQEQVAHRLARFTGRRLPQASISQMEMSGSPRRRRFDAQDLYLLSKVFEVPVVYFLLPSPLLLGACVADTGERVESLLDAVFGTPSTVDTVDRRLIEIAAGDVDTRSLYVTRLSEVDCEARLREIADLLRDVADRHAAGDPLRPRSTSA